jgi:capsular polysaccharide transport system permease protein
MFLREAVSRTMSDRFSWFWLLVEPSLFVIVIVSIRNIAGTNPPIGGVGFASWFLVGMLTFIMFRDTLLKARGAIDASKAMFGYRQVTPIDPVFVRCFFELIVHIFVFTLFLIGGSLLGMDLLADDPLFAMVVWFSAWFFGTGWGVLVSVLSSLVSEVKILVQVSVLPLMIISGIMFPVHGFSPQIKEYMLLNPVFHFVELMRIGFFDSYNSIEGVSLGYVLVWSLGIWFLGMVFHIRFKEKLKAI